MRAVLDDAPVLHQQNQVGAADGGQPVGNDEGRPAGEQCPIDV